MKTSYDKKIALRCVTCGSANFEYNEDKAWAKCTLCGKEYNYDELVESNQSSIKDSLDELKTEFIKDAQHDIRKMLADVCKGNKNLKFK